MKKIKFIQINIYKGKYLDVLIDFLKKEDPDFVSMQEVSLGIVNLFLDKTVSTFEYLKHRLQLNGIFHADINLSDSPVTSGFGNAVFSKFPIVISKVVPLKMFRELTCAELEDQKLSTELPRHILDAVVDVGGLKVHAMSLHGAWTAPPTDTEETVRQANAISDYLNSLGDKPFILGCDLNTVLDSQVVKIISGRANNLMEVVPYSYTTHPTVHKIVPRRLLVDYIFTSKHFKVLSLAIPEVLVSDHLPVVAELEFSP